jgi:hypothetical protein
MYFDMYVFAPVQISRNQVDFIKCITPFVNLMLYDKFVNYFFLSDRYGNYGVHPFE